MSDTEAVLLRFEALWWDKPVNLSKRDVGAKPLTALKPWQKCEEIKRRELQSPSSSRGSAQPFHLPASCKAFSSLLHLILPLIIISSNQLLLISFFFSPASFKLPNPTLWSICLKPQLFLHPSCLAACFYWVLYIRYIYMYTSIHIFYVPFLSSQCYFLSTVLFLLPLWPPVVICHSLDVLSFSKLFSSGTFPTNASCLAR